MDSPAARFRTGGVLAVSAAHALHDTYTAFLAPLLPAFTRTLALSTTQAGLLTVFLQGPSLIQPLIGHLADRVGLRVLVIVAPGAAAILMSLLGVTSSTPLLAALLLVAGLNSAALHSVGPVMVAHLSGDRLGRGMGLWMVGGELGRTLGPIVIVSAVGWLTLRGTPWLIPAGLVVSGMLAVQLRRVPDRAPGGPPGLPWRRALAAMGPLLLPLAAIMVVRGFLLAALTTYLPLYLSASGASLWLAGASLTVLEGAGVAGALTGGMLSDRLGRRAVLFGSFLLTPVFMLAFLATGGAARIVLLLLMGFTSLTVTPVVMALIQESYPENRAFANGVYMAVSFGIRSAVVVLYGMLADLFSLHTAFVVGAIVGLLGLPLTPLLRRRN